MQVVEGAHVTGDLHDGVADGVQAVEAVGGGEDLAFDDAAAVADGDELHGLAVLLEVMAADDDEAADGDAVALVAVQIGDGAVAVPGDLRMQIERMTGDRVAEEFPFILELLQRGGFLAEGGADLRLGDALEKPSCAGVGVLGGMEAAPELLGAIPSEAVKGTGTDEVEGFRPLGPHPSTEVAHAGERASGEFGPPAAQASFREVFDAAQRDADGFASRRGRGAAGGLRGLDRESVAEVVHAGGKEADAEATTLQGVNQRGVEAFAVAEHGGHELGRVVVLGVGSLVGLDRVGGAVGAAEGVTLESGDEVPDLADGGFVMLAGSGGGEELKTHLLDLFHVELHEGAAQHISAAGGEPGEGLTNLQNVLLVGHDAERGAQNGGEACVGEIDFFESLCPTGKLGLFEAVGSSGTDDGDNGHEAVDVSHIGHAGETGHGGAFDVVDAAGIAGGDHVPDAGVTPGLDVAFAGRVFGASEQADFEGAEVEAAAMFDSSNSRLRVPQHGEATLGEDVELDEADGFHSVHVEVRGGPAFAADEGGGEAADGIAGEHDAAGVHFGVAGEAVEHACHEQGGAQRLLLPGAVVALA